jgi:hypothetical protein
LRRNLVNQQQMGERNSPMVETAGSRSLGLYLALLSTLLAGLLACSGDDGQAARVVEQYIEARASGDSETVQTLLCSAMEADLEREQTTFLGVSDVRVEDMACQREEESEVVRCQGRIVALYGAEQTEFPLVSYRIVQEDGEWRWCGEAP